MRRYLLTIVLSISSLSLWSQEIYVGTTMGFADYLENRCGIVYKENGVPKDPFQSLADHGASIVRLRIDHPPYSSSYSEGQMVDHKSFENVKIGMQRAKDAGLKTLLTFGYTSWALEDSQKLNDYVAPLGWQEIALDMEKITDSVYTFTYNVLDEYCSAGLIPEIVSIGNESTWHRLMPNVPEEELPEYDPERSVALHNAGSKAVRDISTKYSTDIKVCFHMRGPATTKWWLEEHTPYGLDYDIIGISLYHAWNKGDFAGFASLGEYVDYIINEYKVDFLVMETAQLFKTGGNDNHVDILGTDNIPPAYSNPPNPNTQKNYLTDITLEVINNGGLGVIVWGADWVGCDCYIYADQWGKGSSWENKSFWDFDYNLHDGVNWMNALDEKVMVTFKVDMSGIDVSNGVFVTGDLPNENGETWKLNSMILEANSVYSYSTEMKIGDEGAYYFLNDNDWNAREKVPAECIVHWGLDRGFKIPAGSTGETFAFVWSSCNEIAPVSAGDQKIYGASLKGSSLFGVNQNPVQNKQLKLSFAAIDNVHLTLLDFQGRLIFKDYLNSSEGSIHIIDLSIELEGAYLLRAFFPELNRYEAQVIVISN
jgi:arabinogalactan endo-1,4-beta-galactosidase